MLPPRRDCTVLPRKDIMVLYKMKCEAVSGVWLVTCRQVCIRRRGHSNKSPDSSGGTWLKICQTTSRIKSIGMRRLHVHTHTDVYIHTHAHTHTLTQTHTQMHTHTHTHIHTQTHTQMHTHKQHTHTVLPYYTATMQAKRCGWNITCFHVSSFLQCLRWYQGRAPVNIS